MGHCHSSAQLGSHGALRGDRAGTARPADVRAGHERSASARQGLSARLLLFVVRAYQLILGPFLGGACRFYPSCSNYAMQAVERHGVRHGAALSIKRLLRCHPFSPGGVDLVPESADAPHEFSEAGQ